MRSFSQIGARVGYFLATANVNGGGVGAEGDDAAINFPTYPGAYVVAGITPVPYVSLTQGELLKDMGRQVTYVDASNNHIAVYRQVQRVNGPTTEGVGPKVDADDGIYGTLYVRVWGADGGNVKVVRTG
jgi:hypothetical protein